MYTVDIFNHYQVHWQCSIISLCQCPSRLHILDFKDNANCWRCQGSWWTWKGLLIETSLLKRPRCRSGFLSLKVCDTLNASHCGWPRPVSWYRKIEHLGLGIRHGLLNARCSTWSVILSGNVHQWNTISPDTRKALMWLYSTSLSERETDSRSILRL